MDKIPNISGRDYRMVEILDRLRISRAVELAWLAGFSDYSYCRKRLAFLEKLGFVQAVREGQGAKCYYLTAAGLSLVGKSNSRTYEISYTTNHALAVGKTCVWIYLNHHINFFEMMVDIDLTSFFVKQAHRPDIYYGGAAYEVELNHKPMPKLVQNVKSNLMFERQIWIVPDDRRNVKANLLEAADIAGAAIEIVPFSDIQECISSANIHDNRYIAACRDPREDVKILLGKTRTHTVLDKYLGGKL